MFGKKNIYKTFVDKLYKKIYKSYVYNLCKEKEVKTYIEKEKLYTQFSNNNVMFCYSKFLKEKRKGKEKTPRPRGQPSHLDSPLRRAAAHGTGAPCRNAPATW